MIFFHLHLIMFLFWGKERRSSSEFGQGSPRCWCGVVSVHGRVFAWERGCVGAWLRVVLSRSEVSVRFYGFLWMSSLNVGIFPCWTFILCIKVKNVDRTASQSPTLICYFEWSLYTSDSADKSLNNQYLNVLIHYYNIWSLLYWMLATHVAGYDK